MKEFLLALNMLFAFLSFSGVLLSFFTEDHEDLKGAALIIYMVLTLAFVINIGGIACGL